MSMAAIVNKYAIQVGWAPIAVTSSKTSSAIDLANAIENLIVVQFGLWTDGTHTPSLTYSGTAGGAGTYTACAAGDIVTLSSGAATWGTAVSSTATAATPQKVSYIGPYRYVKVVQTVAAATTGAISGVMALTKPRKMTSTT